MVSAGAPRLYSGVLEIIMSSLTFNVFGIRKEEFYEELPEAICLHSCSSEQELRQWPYEDDDPTAYSIPLKKEFIELRKRYVFFIEITPKLDGVLKEIPEGVEITLPYRGRSALSIKGGVFEGHGGNKPLWLDSRYVYTIETHIIKKQGKRYSFTTKSRKVDVDSPNAHTVCELL